MTRGRRGGMAATVPCGHPWEAPLAHTWDRTTFGDWLDRNVLDAEARWLGGLGCTLVTCRDPHATSVLCMLNLFNTSGGLEQPISVAGVCLKRTPERCRVANQERRRSPARPSLTMAPGSPPGPSAIEYELLDQFTT